MTPDDKRDEGAQACADDSSGRSTADAAAGASEPGATGLDELAGALPSLPPGERAGEDDADPKALAALAAQRPSAVDEPLARTGARTQVAAPPPARGGGWLVPLLVGIAIGAGGATAVTSLTARPESAARAAPAAEPAAPAVAVPAPELAAAAAVPAAPAAPQPSEGQPGAAAEPANPAPALADPPAAAHGTVVKDHAAVARTGSPAPATPTPGLAAATEAKPAPDDDEPLLPVEPPPPPPPGTLPEGKARAMDALLDDALSPSARSQELARRQAAALASQQQQLPLTPSREDANKAMTVLLPAIRGCAMGQSGLATANMLVRADGRVAGVEITGAPFYGTASGRCMEGVIRRARFSPFRQATLRIKFPLAIQ